MTNISNGYDAGRKSFFYQIDKEAEIQGKNAESWGRILLQAVTASARGFITVDDARSIVERFIAKKQALIARDQKAMKKDSIDGRVTNITTAIRMGSLTAVDSVGVMSRADAIYGQNDGLRDYFNALYRVAAAQVKKENRDYALSDEAILALMRDPEAKPVTVEKKLKDAAKALAAAIKLNDESEEPINLTFAAEAEALINRGLEMLDALQAQAEAQRALAAAQARLAA